MVDNYKQIDGEQNFHEACLASLLELNQLTLDLDGNEFFYKALLYAVQLTQSETGNIHFVNEDQNTFQSIIRYDDVLEQFDKGNSGHQNPLDQASIWTDYVRVGKPVINNNDQNLADRKDSPNVDTVLTRKASVPFYSQDKIRI